MVPTVLGIIFVLLFIVYHSAKEAAHVILAVPFALTGGVFLQKMMGYPFSVAVWVGYIALFGTAIQTGVEVMKPLATPVLGGMISSLLHILVVTPVIFSMLRERELNQNPEAVK